MGVLLFLATDHPRCAVARQVLASDAVDNSAARLHAITLLIFALINIRYMSHISSEVIYVN